MSKDLFKFTVTDFNLVIKNYLETPPPLQDVWIVGELSDVRLYQKGGQLYFNLTDGDARLNCVLYTSFATQLKFQPENGMQVSVRGKLLYQQKRGQIMFQVAFMTQEGLGAGQLQLEALKKKLLAEGLFDPEKKSPLPRYPKCIGIVTAFDSAAMWDFITIFRAYAPHIQLQVYPATMQGITSPSSVIDALQTVREKGTADIVILIRGGGASEDLACFNDETLVRFIANFTIPLVSGIGHEVDYTLTDFVSDFRSPTPSGSAHHIGAPFLEAKRDIQRHLDHATDTLSNRIEGYSITLQHTLSYLKDKLLTKLSSTEEKLRTITKRLELANPLSKFEQGYSRTYIHTSEGTQNNIKSVKDVSPKDTLVTRLKDGTITSQVISIS